MRILILFIFFFALANVNAQKIKVLSERGEVVEGAFISTKNGKTFFTNKNGEVDISQIQSKDTLSITHAAFERLITTKEELVSNNNKVVIFSKVDFLPEATFTTTRWEFNRKEVPVEVISIDPKKIEIMEPQTTADMLAASGKVYVQKSQLGGGSPMIRGFAANRVLLVVDGVRMNNAIFRSGNLQNVISIDANALARTDVILGPASVIYGSDALGGVMGFHTKDPVINYKDTTTIEGSFLSRYSSANNEQTLHADFNLGFNKFGAFTSVSYSKYSDLTMGANGGFESYNRNEYVTNVNGIDSIRKNTNPLLQVGSEFGQLNLVQKFKYVPNNEWVILSNFQFARTSDVPRYDRLIQYFNNDLKFAEWYYGPQKWFLGSINAIYEKETKFYNRVKVIAAFQNFEESRIDRKLNNSFRRKRTENVNAFSLNIDFDKELKEDAFLFYGVEGVFNTVKSDGIVEDIVNKTYSETAARYPDNSLWESNAIYVNYKKDFSKKLSLLTGVRFNQIWLYAPFDTTYFDFPFEEVRDGVGALSGSAGLAYKPGEHWQINVNASTGFRAPNIDDVGKVFDSEPGTVVVPNVNLKPEYAYNLDFGIKLTDSKVYDFELTGYGTFLNNAMVRDAFTFNGQDSIMYDGTLSAVQAIVNRDKGYVYGTSVEFVYQPIKRLTFRTNANYTKGFDSEGKPLRHVAPFFATLSATYENLKVQLFTSVNYNAEISYSNLADTERNKTHLYVKDENGNPYSPSWYTVNAGFAYKVTEKVKLSTSISNILDLKYRSYSSGIIAPGRNVNVSLRANF